MRPPLSILFLLPAVYGSVCPNGYTKADGSDCFKAKSFYDSFAGQYIPKTYDEAEVECNSDYGGLLTSIHSDAENHVVRASSCPEMYKNIGLKCKGSDCKWDDGSPMDYHRFLDGPPQDDGKLRCFTMDGTAENRGSWYERSCGQEKKDCWVCRVKAKTIDCDKGETEYNGGCVSVQLKQLDQKTAAESCPGGGRLVSIHSYNENDLYKQIALGAGVTGTITIGGGFPNGVFEWLDRSYVGYTRFAYGFPNTNFGTCLQMLLDSEFGNQGQWTNIDCSVNQPFICIRDGTDPSDVPQPKADAHCPPNQYYSGMGTIFSPNYPLSIPGQQKCEYVIGTVEGSEASVKFVSYDCQSGTTLAFFDGLNSNQPFKTFTNDAPVINQSYFSTTNVLKIVFTANDTSAPVGTGWEAEFTGVLP